MPGLSDFENDAHGGDIAAVSARFGRQSSDWVDLSTGINPWSYPTIGIDQDAWRRLPQSTEVARLKQAAAQYFGAGNPDCLAMASGTQAFIQILPSILPVSRVSILGRTYFEHEKCWRKAGAAVDTVEELPPHDRSLIVVNPNNPDGRVVDRKRLLDWAENAAPKGHFLIVDEAFADVQPENSLVPSLPRPNLIVLRSFGKFFGLAGLRLGFLASSTETAVSINDRLGPWSVSGPALSIGYSAYSDKKWHQYTRAMLTDKRKRLESILTNSDFDVIGGTDLFVLASAGWASTVWQHLAKSGISARSFADQPTWLRFGLPGPEIHWDRLESSLRNLPLPVAPTLE